MKHRDGELYGYEEEFAPARARGLKRVEVRDPQREGQVRAREGAWIETPQKGLTVAREKVRAREGAWIETSSPPATPATALLFAPARARGLKLWQ